MLDKIIFTVYSVYAFILREEKFSFKPEYDYFDFSLEALIKVDGFEVLD